MILKFDKYNVNVRVNRKIGNDKNFLLIHGFAVDHREMIRVSKGLPGNTYLVDLLDHGKSTVNSENTKLDYKLFVESINAVIKKLKLTNVTIIGHSLGSLLSLVVATENKAIKKVVLMSMPHIDIAQDKELINRLVSEDKKIISELVNNDFFFEPSLLTTKVVTWLIQRKNHKNRAKYLEVFENLSKSINQTIFDKHLNKLKVPTLLITGENDPLSTIKDMQYIADKIKIKHKLVIIPHARHSICLQKFKEVIQIINDDQIKK